MPLVTNKKNISGTATFTIKPNTTSGSLEIYENGIGTSTTTRIKISGKKVSDGSSIGSDVSYLSLTNGVDYTIDFKLSGNKNYMIKWAPDSNTIGANKFETSSLVALKFEE